MVVRFDEKWGEMLCVFVELVMGVEMIEVDFIVFCREYLVSFKCFKMIVFCEFFKMLIGKI